MTVPEYSPTYPKWPFERAFGGIGTAAAPGGRYESEHWPKGRSAPYSETACDELVKACHASSSNQVLVFLVGGAGNGKSKLASDVVSALHCETEAPSAFAQRTYSYKLSNSRSLIIVNDATIPPDDTSGEASPLVTEIDEVLRNNSNLLACVNRGVLIGEISTLPEECTLGGRIGKALLDGRSVSDNCFREHDGSILGVYRSFCVEAPNGGQVEVRIVYMDNASLLECWPKQTAPMRITQCLIGSDSGAGEDRVFAPLLREFSQNILSTSGESHPLDPILANAKSFSCIKASQSWCCVARGAEVISGNHFTYRELWAIACYSIFGETTQQLLKSLQTQIKEDILKIGHKPELAEIQNLALHRAHMNLFSDASITGSTLGAAATASPALTAFWEADPLRGYGRKRGKDYVKALALLATIEDGEFPMTKLAGSDEEGSIKTYWTEFDAWVEKSCSALLDNHMSAPDANERKKILSFYGNYMFRLLGLAKGWPAQVPVIMQWQRAWNHAQQHEELPEDLDRALKSLILPDTNGRQRAAFPAFRGRVDNLSPGDSAITIDVDTGRFHIVAKPIGSMIEFELRDYKRGDDRISGGLLDFHLIRECMARLSGTGFSDALMAVEPRVERIRSGVLASALATSKGPVRYRLFQK